MLQLARLRFLVSGVALSSLLLVGLIGVPATLGEEATHSSGAVAGQRPLPTFGAGVDMVNLCVAVTDVRDHYVNDLGASDFRVMEDGVPQDLVLFNQERLPLSVAILVDSSLSMQPSLPAVKTAALRLVRALRAQDEAEVIQFNHHFGVLQEFTSDQRQLASAVEGIIAEGATSVYNALYLTLKDGHFRHHSNALRRQAIVVLTDGEDTSSIITDDQVLDVVRKADVTIYTISLRRPGPVAAQIFDADSKAVYFLTALARETGGRSYFPNALTQLDGVYDRIADELRTQYALGYVSNNTVRDGKWRRIAIQTGRGDLLLRHRLGYFASPLGRAHSAAAAVASTTAANQ